MIITKSIQDVKKQEEEKVAISLKVPFSVKNNLQDIADQNEVSMNNLITSILINVLKEEAIIEQTELKNKDVDELTSILDICIDELKDLEHAPTDVTAQVTKLEDRISFIMKLIKEKKETK